MVRYIVDTEAKTIDDLKAFDYDGYRLSALKKARIKTSLFLRGSFSSSLLLKYLKKRCLTAFFFLISERKEGCRKCHF